MPAAGTKKYIVTSPPNARSPKGFYAFKQRGVKENGEPDGEIEKIPVGESVMLTPEAAAPLVKIGRLRLASEG